MLYNKKLLVSLIDCLVHMNFNYWKKKSTYYFYASKIILKEVANPIASQTELRIKDPNRIFSNYWKHNHTYY